MNYSDSPPENQRGIKALNWIVIKSNDICLQLPFHTQITFAYMNMNQYLQKQANSIAGEKANFPVVILHVWLYDPFKQQAPTGEYSCFLIAGSMNLIILEAVI